MKRLAAALAVGAALAAHVPALRAPLVDNDSFAVVYAQPALARPGALPDLLSPAYFATFGTGGWRPLSTLAYAAVFRAAGGAPFAYKLVKLALHAAAAALVFALGCLLVGDRPWALAGAAAYFLRLRNPAFEGLAFFPDYLSAFFALAAAYSHLRGGRGTATGALYACALLSKESALPLPALLLLTHACFPATRPGGWRRAAAPLLPSALAALAYLAASKWLIVVENFYGPAVWTSFPAAGLPLRYAAYWRAFFPGLLAAAFAALALARAAGAPAEKEAWGRRLAFAAGWTALGLWSALNAWPHFPRFAAYLAPVELRFLALPGAAMAWLFAWAGAGGRAGRGWSAAAWALAAAWLAFSARTSLPSAARLAASLEAPAAGRPLYESELSRAALSLPLLRRGEPRAAAELEAAMTRLMPPADAGRFLAFFGDASLYGGWKARLATRLMNRESLPELLSDLAAETSYRKGAEALRGGRALEAAASFRAALAADPGHAAACLGLSAARASGADLRRCALPLPGGFSAEEAPRAAVRLAAAAYDRALAERRLEDALPAFDALRDALGPAWGVDLALSRAAGLAREGRYDEAERAYAGALAAAPLSWSGREDAERERARLRLGARAAFEAAMRAFAAGDRARSIAGFSEALRLSPDFAEAYLSRGALYADEGRWDDALRDYDAGLRLPFIAGRPVAERLASARAAALRRPR